MTQTEIIIKNLCIQFSSKICISDFSATIRQGDRIAIIGENGSGKSSLLQLIGQANQRPSKNIIFQAADCQLALVPQLMNTDTTLSGGEFFQRNFSRALQAGRDILLLDEPTNHLDKDNRQSLIRCLLKQTRTLIFASHDADFIEQCATKIWQIEAGQVSVFNGNYQDLQREAQIALQHITQKKQSLKHQLKTQHQALMQEQLRASKSTRKGRKQIANRKWPTIVSYAKASRANQTAAKKQTQIKACIDTLNIEREKVQQRKIIRPNFRLQNCANGGKNLVTITEGQVYYPNTAPVLSDLSLTVQGNDRIVIQGKNGSGKTTLLKAIVGHDTVLTKGFWVKPQLKHIAYLDQNYAILTDTLSVYQSIEQYVILWSEQDIRAHLRNFMFEKNHQVEAMVSTLSGGERARLSLALLAIHTPRLLILDEITNNLDMVTKQHVTDVISTFPGALVVISHEDNFIKAIGCNKAYTISNGRIESV